MNHLDEAKLLSALLGVLKKESSKVRDSLLEELREQLQKDIEDQSGVKYLQLEEIEDLQNPIPVQVFRGDQGPKGDRGAKGAKGDVGPRGLRGIVGPQGAPGSTGPVGPTGPQGVRGETGPQGPAGRDGVDGVTPDIKPVEDKLLNLLNDFKGSISAQVTRMAYAKGGGSSGSGEVRLLRLDDVDTTNLADGKFLRYNATTGKLEFVESSVSLNLSNHDGHIIPAANNTYDLGSPQRQWRDLYLSGTSLFINGVPALQQDPETGNIVLAANTVIQTANGVNDPVASQPNLDLYLEVANATSIITSEINNLVDGAPAALDTLNELAAAVSDDENFAGTVVTSLGTKASNNYVNTQLNLKADTADLNNYLQVANNFSGVYNDLTGKPNLDIYASNTALQLKANASDLTAYLQVANVNSLITAQVDSVIDGAPGTLDTLNELAAALGDDANFVTTVTAGLAGKASNTYVNTQLANKANTSDLDNYLQVANNFSGVYSDLTGKPNLDVYASNTSLQLKANASDLNNYLQVANSFSGVYSDLTGKPNLDQYLQVANTLTISVDYNNLVNTPNLDVYASNTALSLKANSVDLDQYLQVANSTSFITSAALNPYLQVANAANFTTQTDLNNYLQVANNFSGVYSDLTGKPNLDVYASNTALQLKANASDLNNYLQVANNKTIVAGNNVSLTTNSTSIVINSTGGSGGGAGNLDEYLQVANTNNFVSTAQDHGSGQTLIKSKINNILTLNTLKAGPNITIQENSDGEIQISATGELSVSDSLDFGFVNNDFGSIADDADSDPQFDFGTL